MKIIKKRNKFRPPKMESTTTLASASILNIPVNYTNYYLRKF